MNKLLAWVTGIALMIGVGTLINFWLGLAAGCAWAFHVLRTQEEKTTRGGSREARAYALKERLEHLEDAANQDPILFLGAAALILWFLDKTLLGGSLEQIWSDRGWRSILTWPFWIFAALIGAFMLILRKIFFVMLRAFARIRYPEFNRALPFVEDLSVRDGILAWGDLNLHMTAHQAANVVGYESILQTNGSEDDDEIQWFDARYRNRQVQVYWNGKSSNTQIAEISLSLGEHEAELGASACLARIRKKFPVLQEQNGELWLHAGARSVVHVSLHRGRGAVHLIRADAREAGWSS